MFEIWESVSDPTLWLVFRESPSFPGAFAADDWAELGLCRAADDVAAEIDRDGYITMRATGPFDPDTVLGA